MSVRLQTSPNLTTSQIKLRLEAAMSTTVFSKFSFSFGVLRIEQQKLGHISTVTGQNRPKIKDCLFRPSIWVGQQNWGYIMCQQHLSQFQYNGISQLILIWFWRNLDQYQGLVVLALYKWVVSWQLSPDVWPDNICPCNICPSFSIMECLS